MKFGNSRQFLLNVLFLSSYCAIISFASYYSVKKPAYNWDILPYMAIILSYDNADAQKMHTDVYAIAKEQIPAEFYDRLVAPYIEYRKRVAQNHEDFISQLPFYIVKPLYTSAGYLLYKAGVSLPMATVWPSVIAYLLTGLLLVYWLKKYWPVFYACAGSVLIMLSPPLLSVANLSSPDGLSGLMLFSAIYLSVEKKHLLGAIILLVLAIIARADNIIPAICFLSAIAFADKRTNILPVRKYLLLITAMLLVCFIILFNAYSFGWSIFYYPTFVKQLNISYSINHEFVFSDYILLAKTQFLTGLYFSLISLFFFLILLLVWDAPLFGSAALTMEQLFSILFVLIIIIRFVLHPLVADRLYIPYYLSALVFLVKKESFLTKRRQLYIK